MTRLVVGLLAVAALAQQPARDRLRPPAVGTAIIEGVVTTGERPVRPLRRARVVLSSPDHHFARTVVTENDGTFRFDQVPSGRYRLTASKPAYLPMSYGATRTGRPGATIVLRNGETLEASMRLDRGGVLTGAVVDPGGQPAGGIFVEVHTQTYLRGAHRLTRVPTPTVVTDDRGEYRVYGLAPGEYFVSARPPRALTDVQVLSDREIRRALAEAREVNAPTRPGPTAARPVSRIPAEPRQQVALAAVFYPGTPVLAHARPVSIGPGEERHGIDLQLERVPVATVQGTVTAPGGPPRFTMVTLTPRRGLDDPDAGVGFEAARSGGVGAGGTFTFRGVAPGEYTLQAQVMSLGASAPRDEPDAPSWASTDIIVDGNDVAGVGLILQPPLTISGQVAFEGLASPALPGPLSLALPLERVDARTRAAPARLRLDAERRFLISGIIPGLHVFGSMRGIRTPLGRWWLKSVAVGGRDLLDRPLDLRQAVANAVVTFTDRASEISGTLREAHGHGAPDSHVVLFPVERRYWFFYSPRIAPARTTSEGRYRVMNLPPGEYFVASAHDLQPGEWWDPAVLERLADGAARIELPEAGRLTIDVEIPPTSPDLRHPR